jgi:hypothetical protein
VDELLGLRLLRIVAPGLATLVFVVACVAFPRQTTAVLMDAVEKRATHLAEIVGASFPAGGKSRDELPAR